MRVAKASQIVVVVTAWTKRAEAVDVVDVDRTLDDAGSGTLAAPWLGDQVSEPSRGPLRVVAAG